MLRNNFEINCSALFACNLTFGHSPRFASVEGAVVTAELFSLTFKSDVTRVNVKVNLYIVTFSFKLRFRFS